MNRRYAYPDLVSSVARQRADSRQSVEKRRQSRRSSSFRPQRRVSLQFPLRSSKSSEMKRTPVQSTAIRSTGYDSAGKTLDVEFLNGRVYRYFDVQEFLYRGFMLAGSKGDYFRT